MMMGKGQQRPQPDGAANDKGSGRFMRLICDFTDTLVDGASGQVWTSRWAWVVFYYLRP